MKKKILFFDPFPDRIHTLNILRQIEEAEVISVNSVDEVLSALKSNNYVLLITEINIPNMTLEDYLKKILDVTKDIDVSIMSVTGTKNIFDLTLAEKCKVRPVFLKPILPHLLRQAVGFLIVNKRNGLILSNETNSKLFYNCFDSMGLLVNVATKIFEFNRLLFEKDIHFIIFDESFEELSAVQLLNKLLLSSKKPPIYFFLKQRDSLLSNLVSQYGSTKIQVQPWNLEKAEEDIQKLILENEKAPPISAAPIKDMNKKPQEKETSDKDSDMQELKNLTEEVAVPSVKEVSRYEEVSSGILSVRMFIQGIGMKIPDMEIATPITYFFKTGGSFQKMKCIDELRKDKSKRYYPVLNESYKNGNDALREFVIEIYMDLPPDNVIMNCLCVALNDRLPTIQHNAIAALSKYKLDLVARYVKTKLFATEVKVRQAAAALLENFNDISIFNDFINAILKVEDVVIYRSFLNYIEIIFDKIKDLNVFLPVFNSRSTLLKENLLEYLISKKDKRIVPFLQMNITSGDRVLMRLAIQGYEELREPTGVKYMVEMLDTKEGSYAESAILKIINVHNSPKYAELFTLIMQKGDDRLRERTVTVVKEFKEKYNLPILDAAIKYGGMGAKVAAIEAMEDWSPSTVVLVIGYLLDDPDRVISDYVYTYIKEHYDKSCIQSLIRVFLASKTEQSKDMVAHLLSSLVKDEDSNSIMRFLRLDNYSLLIKILKMYGTTLGKFTSEVLGKHVSEKSSYEIILRTLYEKEVDARAEAAFLLGEQHYLESVPHLEKFVEDENWYVRRMVIEALSKLEAKHMIPVFIKKLKDSNAAVRYASAVGLTNFQVKFKESIFPIIMEEESVKVLEQLVFIVAPFRDQKTANVYLPRLSATSLITRVNAASSLLTLWDDINRDMIKSWLNYDKWPLRLLALAYFSKGEVSDIIDKMDVFIMDKSEEIRIFLINLIIKEKKEEAISLLIQFVSDESPKVRKHVILELNKMKAFGFMDIVLQVFEKENEDIVLTEIFNIFEEQNDERIPKLIHLKFASFNDNFKKRSYTIMNTYEGEQFYESHKEDKK